MKRFLWVFFCFALLACIYFIVDSYALLESSGNATTNIKVGKWEIKLNGYDITKTKSINFSDLVYLENDNVEDGYFAPGVSATYQIVIDPSNTDVAIRYDISIDLSAIEEYPNINFEVTNASITPSDSEGLMYSGVISLESIKRSEKMTLNLLISWEDDELYDESDSSLINSNKISFPISIHFSQYLGEEI